MSALIQTELVKSAGTILPQEKRTNSFQCTTRMVPPRPIVFFVSAAWFLRPKVTKQRGHHGHERVRVSRFHVIVSLFLFNGVLLRHTPAQQAQIILRTPHVR